MFEAAAEQDDADAQYNLGLMFDQSGDVTKAKKWYKKQLIKIMKRPETGAMEVVHPACASCQFEMRHS